MDATAHDRPAADDLHRWADDGGPESPPVRPAQVIAGRPIEGPAYPSHARKPAATVVRVLDPTGRELRVLAVDPRPDELLVRVGFPLDPTAAAEAADA